MKTGDYCKVSAKELHPTQFALGMLEVRQKAANLKSLDEKALKEYLKAHLVPVVIGPGGVPYIIDHHHLARALMDSDIHHPLYAQIEANYSDLTQANFWKLMNEKYWTYLFDENGRGPRDPETIPKSVTELADDPYRSLAWAIREKGDIKKVEVPFTEFKWAEYFRPRIKIDSADKNLKTSIEEARKISHLPEAKTLPGYLGPCKGLLGQ